MAIYRGYDMVAGGGGSGGGGSGGGGSGGAEHVYLSWPAFQALSAAGLLKDDVIYMLSSDGGGGGGGLELGETSDTAYRGDRGKAAYDHSQIASGNPHGVSYQNIQGTKPAYTAAEVHALPDTTTHTSGDVQNLAGAAGIKVVASESEITSTTDNVLYFVIKR